jgi:hypothetical protein
MIISHKYKFIFIKTTKTAGTSIEVFLSQHCGPDDVLTPIRPPVAPHVARNYMGLWNPLPEIVSDYGLKRFRSILTRFLKRRKFYNHIPARTVKQLVSPEVWNNYFKFCVERNPWDKTLSHYHMVKDRSGGNLTFDQYLQKGRFSVNYPIYCDGRGGLLVDKVVKYESLMDELGAIFGKLGIPFDGSLGVKAKSEHRKDRTPYQQIYTERQKEIVAKAFRIEIEMHGYKF